MKYGWFLLAIVLFGWSPEAQGAAPTGKTSENTPVLRKLLARFPEADGDEDGILTEEEARDYQKTRRQAQGKGRRAPTHKDVEYGPHPRNRLDVWLAATNQPTPLVIYIHGGSFVSGDKSSASGSDIQRCLDKGISYAAVSYRYRTMTAMTNVILDIARSVQFLRHKAGDWNLDKTRVAVYGGSAGAGAALWLAAHDDLAIPGHDDPVLRESTRVVAAGALSPQATYNLARWPEILGMPEDTLERVSQERKESAAKLLTGEPDEGALEAMMKFLDMLAFMDAGDPPLYVMSNGPDVVPGDLKHHPRHAKAVKKRCDEVGIPCVLVVRETPPAERVFVLDFLFQHLLP